MSIEELKRTRYRDAADASINHETRDHMQDSTHYHVPLMRLHNVALHRWGIGTGLEVVQTASSTLVIQEGLAIDVEGRMIPLALIGEEAGQPGRAFINDVTAQGNLVDVPVNLPTTDLADGTYYLTIEMAITQIIAPDGVTLIPVEGRVVVEGTSQRVISTPLIQAQLTGDFANDGAAIVLATMEISGGQITSLSGSDRQLAHMAVGDIVILQGSDTNVGADPAVGERERGRIGPLPTGGLAVEMSDVGDQMIMQTAGGNNFQALRVNADQVVVTDGAGRDVFGVNANQAALQIGVDGHSGQMIVQDEEGRDVLQFDAANATVKIGTTGHAGELGVCDEEGRETLAVDGSNANLIVGTEGNAGAIGVLDQENRVVFEAESQNRARLSIGAEGKAGELRLRDNQSRPAAHLSAAGAIVSVGTEGNAGDLVMRDGQNRAAAHLNAAAAQLSLGTQGNAGDLSMRDNQNRVAAHLSAAGASLSLGTQGNAGDLLMRDGQNRSAAHLNAGVAQLSLGTQGNAGDLSMRDNQNRAAAHLSAAGASLSLGTQGNAGDLLMRDGQNRSAAHLNAGAALLSLGTQGNAGDLQIRNSQNRIVMSLNGSDAAMSLGASGQDGDLFIRNNAGQTTARIDGQTGAITANGFIRSNNSILGANPTRNVHTRVLWARNSPRTVTSLVDLGSSRRFIAYTAIVFMDPLANFDRGDAFALDVFMVDGNMTRTVLQGGDHLGPPGSRDNLRSPVHVGTGRRITFRARTFQNAEVVGIGVVFYE